MQVGYVSDHSESPSLSFFLVRHLTKLFDSIASLTFSDANESGGGTIAVGMTAKDGEYVEFSSITNCVGPVSVL